jgi:hypothetical protein
MHKNVFIGHKNRLDEGIVMTTVGHAQWGPRDRALGLLFLVRVSEYNAGAGKVQASAFQW